VSGTDGSQPYESLSFSYTSISQKHHYEKEGGELQSGGVVTYDLPTGKMTSGK
jgi:type VI secretion system secreted protein Hcp